MASIVDNRTTIYTWKIKKFSSRDSLYSPIFHLHGNKKITFGLEMKAKGSADWFHNTHVMFQLLVNDGAGREKISVKYQLSIVDVDGNKCNSQDLFALYDTTKRGIDVIQQALQYNISRAYLFDNAQCFLAEDKLKIFCEVFNIDEPNVGTVSRLPQDFQTLLENGKFSDVSLMIGDKQFRVHKTILVARSPVFAAMFQHEQMKESLENKVDIIDISVEVFEQFLRYIYTGKLYSLEQYVPDMLIVADKYQVEDLKFACEQYLANKLTIETVADTFLLADKHQAAKLKILCIKYINKHTSEVKLTDGWKQLVNTRLELVLDLYLDISCKKH